MNAKEEFQQFIGIIKKVREAITKLRKYKGNQHYQQRLELTIGELNRTHKFLKAKVAKLDNDQLKEKFKTVDEIISLVLSKSKYDEKLEAIKNLERFWPELEIEFENLKLNLQSFDVPEEIPITEYRLDLEEAIKDFDNGCFVSSLVLCRRAYEGALVEAYKAKEKREPFGEIKCMHCGKIIRDKAYFGIAKLHEWAIKNGLVTEKLKQVGFLVTDIGAGAAHPPLTEFPRDKELAKLGIIATITLLKELNSKTSNTK